MTSSTTALSSSSEPVRRHPALVRLFHWGTAILIVACALVVLSRETDRASGSSTGAIDATSTARAGHSVRSDRPADDAVADGAVNHAGTVGKVTRVLRAWRIG